MRLGFDFDNTIVSYDRLFHKVALEKAYIPASTPVNKNAVRDTMRSQNQEPLWTELQGYVYGERMQEAEVFPDVLEVLGALHKVGHELYIISHKTKKPYIGPPYDLHASARTWISTHLIDGQNQLLIPMHHVFFHERKEEKIARIRETRCDIFLDDLPEILLHPDFPSTTRAYLFAPCPHDQLAHVASWKDLCQMISYD